MMTLVIGSEKKLEMEIALYKPNTPGPHPVIIEEDGNPGVSKNVPLLLAKNFCPCGVCAGTTSTRTGTGWWGRRRRPTRTMTGRR